MNEMDFFMLTLFIPLSCIWTFHRAETQRHSKWCLEEFGAFKHTRDQIISAVMRKHEARSKNQTYQCNSDYDAIKIFCCSALHCNAHSSACATFSLFCCCIDSRCFLFYAIVIFFFFFWRIFIIAFLVDWYKGKQHIGPYWIQVSVFLGIIHDHFCACLWN